jgi:predicted lipoprotein with Yx(FWY)xxD motif
VKNSLVVAATATSIAALALVGCGRSGSAGGSTAPTAGTDVSAATTDLGTVVVDGRGMTAYVFDKDTADSGKSACVGDCASMWPAITSSSAKPKADGISGTVATIAAAAGGKQVTIDGRPVYTFSGDSAAGDTKGQGVKGIWHVVSPAGKAITKTAPAASTGGY